MPWIRCCGTCCLPTVEHKIVENGSTKSWLHGWVKRKKFEPSKQGDVKKFIPSFRFINFDLTHDWLFSHRKISLFSFLEVKFIDIQKVRLIHTIVKRIYSVNSSIKIGSSGLVWRQERNDKDSSLFVTSFCMHWTCLRRSSVWKTCQKYIYLK